LTRQKKLFENICLFQKSFLYLQHIYNKNTMCTLMSYYSTIKSYMKKHIGIGRTMT